MKNKEFFELNQQFEIINKITLNGQSGYKIKDIYTNEELFISDNVKKNIIGQYKTEMKFKNRRELLRKFEEIQPFMANRLLQITYYKKPNFKELYKSTKTYKSLKSYEIAHKYGELRTMKGSFVLSGYKFKERDGYLVMKDIEDNMIEKPIIIRNMVSFTFDNIKYFIDD